MFSTKRLILLLATFAILLASISAFAGDKSGYLGVMLQDINSSMAKALQMDAAGGVLINEVVDDSPAQEADFRDGDVILEFDGKTIKNNKALTKAVRRTSPGEKIEVKVLRSGKTKTLDVVVGEKENIDIVIDEDINIVMEDFDGMFAMNRGFLGVQLDDMTEQLGEYFEVEDGKGALITKVTEDSGAEKAGLKAGDVIIGLGDTEIDSAGDLHKAMAKTEPEQEIDIKISRKGKTKEFEVTLGEMSSDSFRKIEIISDDNNFSIRAPKMLMKHFKHHSTPNFPHKMHNLEEVRESLEEMRLELEELRKELEEK